MNIMPDLKNIQLLKIYKIQLLSKNEIVTFDTVLDVWNIDYNKILGSNFHFETVGIDPRIINWISDHRHVEYIKIVGIAKDFEKLKANDEKCEVNIVWNLPCNMYINNFTYEDNNMSIDLSGEIW
jgi:mRNA-degrading endonuclease HigB of HigAB toxin-antitoxin module